MYRLKLNFCIQIFRDGTRQPMILSSAPFGMLSNLSFGHLSSSKGVKLEIEGMKSVLEHKKDVHLFGGDDWCIIEFKGGISRVLNGFDEFQPMEIPSKRIYQLMKDWCDFLIAYERNEIPGIIIPQE